MTQFESLNAQPAGDEVRVETMRGSEWLVAPVVLVREGVLNGGFLGFDEIQTSAPGWNGRPVTAPPEQGTEAANLAPSDPSGHPVEGETENGTPNFVSANREPFVEDMHVGLILNAEAREDLPTPGDEQSERGLVAEQWINLDRAETVGEYAVEAVEAIADGSRLDVSTGYFHRPLDKQGRHGGERYEAVQTDLLPDHLALLPNETGACSWADGCGAPYPAGNEQAANDLGTAADDTATGDRAMAVNALDAARTPEYDGTREGTVPDEWPPSLDDYVAALGIDGDPDTVADLAESERMAIAERTLLGDPEADTFDEVRFFPVVDPDTDELIENALEAVITGRGAQADISDSQLASARRVAYRLLNDEFDRDLDVGDDLTNNEDGRITSLGRSLAERVRSLLSTTNDESAAHDAESDGCSPGPCSCGEHTEANEDDDGDESLDPEDDTTTNTTMKHDIETLAERSAFDAETLTEWDEDDLDALAESLDDDPTANTDTDTDDDLRERVEELERQVEAQEREKRERLAEQVADATEHEAEALVENDDEFPTPALETLAETVEQGSTSSDDAAPQGDRVNYLGQAGSSPEANEDDDADTDAVANVGALASIGEGGDA